MPAGHRATQGWSLPDDGAGCFSRGRYLGVDLRPFLNHACASFDRRPFAALGHSSFPAEELGSLPRPLVVGGVPLWLPAFCDGEPDNTRCDGQRLEVPPGRYCALAVLGASEMGSYKEQVWLRFDAGPEASRTLGLTRWILPEPQFGELAAYAATHCHAPGRQVPGIQPRLWVQFIVLDPDRALIALVLPENILMHVLALTLIRPPRGRAVGSLSRRGRPLGGLDPRPDPCCPPGCPAGPSRGVVPCPVPA
ncbi:MAG: hypothetical protein K6T75_00990 [Acetobacteraceae bacterium]|nr:hypothetical protein [Acetobacteraceae bacterium]